MFKYKYNEKHWALNNSNINVIEKINILFSYISHKWKIFVVNNNNENEESK